MIDYGTVVTDSVRTDQINSSGVRVDMESQTKVLNPENYTTKTMVKYFGDAIIAKDMQHKYRERRPIPNWTTITVADAAAQTTIEVADYTIFSKDRICWTIRDGQIIEQLIVTSDPPSDATVDVVQFHGTTGSGGLQFATEIGDIVVVGPEAHAEGEAVPDAFSNITVDKTDNLMQFDRAVKTTDINKNIGHYDSTEAGLTAALAMAWIEENAHLNLALYMSEDAREVTTASGPRRYAFNGIFQRLTENVSDFSGAPAGFTRQALQEMVRKTTDDSARGGRKILVAGININNAISGWPEGAIRVDPDSDKWGIKVRVVRTQYGDISVVYDNVLNAKHGVADRGVIIDTAHMRQMYLGDLKPRAYMNITNARDIHNTEHAVSGTWGVQTSSVESFAQIQGVQ